MASHIGKGTNLDFLLRFGPVPILAVSLAILPEPSGPHVQVGQGLPEPEGVQGVLEEEFPVDLHGLLLGAVAEEGLGVVLQAHQKGAVGLEEPMVRISSPRTKSSEGMAFRPISTARW